MLVKITIKKLRESERFKGKKFVCGYLKGETAVNCLSQVLYGIVFYGMQVAIQFVSDLIDCFIYLFANAFEDTPLNNI
jgi:hypothetical protein